MCDVVLNHNKRFELIKTFYQFVCELCTLLFILNTFTLCFAPALHDMNNFVNTIVFKDWFAA